MHLLLQGLASTRSFADTIQIFLMNRDILFVKSASQPHYFKTLSCLAKYHPCCIKEREHVEREQITAKDASKIILRLKVLKLAE